MPTLVLRKLVRFGQSGLVLTIPKGWARYHGLEPGDKVEVIANRDLVVRLESEAKKRDKKEN